METERPIMDEAPKWLKEDEQEHSAMEGELVSLKEEETESEESYVPSSVLLSTHIKTISSRCSTLAIGPSFGRQPITFGHKRIKGLDTLYIL
jgi:hypothetical protein